MICRGIYFIPAQNIKLFEDSQETFSRKSFLSGVWGKAPISRPQKTPLPCGKRSGRQLFGNSGIAGAAAVGLIIAYGYAVAGA